VHALALLASDVHGVFHLGNHVAEEERGVAAERTGCKTFGAGDCKELTTNAGTAFGHIIYSKLNHKDKGMIDCL
jgi:hypothetical protein